MLVSVEPKFEAGSYITNTYNPKATLLEQEKHHSSSKRWNSHRMFALGLLVTVFMLLIICANIRVVSGAPRPLTEEELRELCPDEKEFCYERALQGSCYGKSLKAQLVAKQCKCACENAHHRRIQNCCRTVGDHEMKFCLPLCGYNTTVNELGSGLGLKCVSQLTTWAYCAADANDNTECCKGKGVEEECLSFCKGDVPTCDLHSIFSYQPCLMKLGKIIECQMENLQAEARFDPKWRPECDWQK